MSTRIRYVKDAEGNFLSMQVYKDSQGYEIKTRIGSDGKSGSVVLASDLTPIVELTATSPHKIKIKLKKAMKQLGVKFDKEKRG